MVRRLPHATDLNANCIITHYPTNRQVTASDFVPSKKHNILDIQSSKYADLLSEFPSVIQDIDFTTPPKHDIRHTILTTGRPVATKARRLVLGDV